MWCACPELCPAAHVPGRSPVLCLQQHHLGWIGGHGADIRQGLLWGPPVHGQPHGCNRCTDLHNTPTAAAHAASHQTVAAPPLAVPIQQAKCGAQSNTLCFWPNELLNTIHIAHAKDCCHASMTDPVSKALPTPTFAPRPPAVTLIYHPPLLTSPALSCAHQVHCITSIHLQPSSCPCLHCTPPPWFSLPSCIACHALS